MWCDDARTSSQNNNNEITTNKCHRRWCRVSWSNERTKMARGRKKCIKNIGEVIICSTGGRRHRRRWFLVNVVAFEIFDCFVTFDAVVRSSVVQRIKLTENVVNCSWLTRTANASLWTQNVFNIRVLLVPKGKRKRTSNNRRWTRRRQRWMWQKNLMQKKERDDIASVVALYSSDNIFSWKTISYFYCRMINGCPNHTSSTSKERIWKKRRNERSGGVETERTLPHTEKWIAILWICNMFIVFVFLRFYLFFFSISSLSQIQSSTIQLRLTSSFVFVFHHSFMTIWSIWCAFCFCCPLLPLSLFSFIWRILFGLLCACSAKVENHVRRQNLFRQSSDVAFDLQQKLWFIQCHSHILTLWMACVCVCVWNGMLLTSIDGYWIGYCYYVTITFDMRNATSTQMNGRTDGQMDQNAEHPTTTTTKDVNELGRRKSMREPK